MTETIGQHLAATLRSTAQAYAAEDQTAPCVLLWTDPKREWTPQGYLVSNLGGLGLDVPKNQATHEALAGALPLLFQEPLPLL